MDNLIEINSMDDIFPEYRNTPAGLLLEYHILGKPLCFLSLLRIINKYTVLIYGLQVCLSRPIALTV